MIYLGALILGFSIWLLTWCYYPQVAINKKAIHFCVILTGFFLFAAAMFEVQVGIIASVNEVLSRYANSL